MRIISRDGGQDRIAAAVETVLALPADEFDFFVQNALRAPEQYITLSYESDPGEQHIIKPHIGIEEFVPETQRSYKYRGETVWLLDFLTKLREQAKNKADKQRQQEIEDNLNWWDMFVSYYSRTAKVDPNYVTRLLMLLEQPQLLLDLLKEGKDVELKTHIGKICDNRMQNSYAIANIFGKERITKLRQIYEGFKQQGINFDRYINPYYTFTQIQSSHGGPAIGEQPYVDDEDFTVNPKLLKQLDLQSCRERTPEGKAIWLYTKMCEIMKYDEGYFYSKKRFSPNDHPIRSLRIAGEVTADTVVTCFNFSRIAVKLLNKIAGVNATLIAVGGNLGHFRFGYYTDNVSVDAEPINAKNGYNDLARVKLGILPTGLRVLYGKEIMQDLMQRTVAPMVTAHKKDLCDYLQALKDIPATTEQVQIDIHELLAELKSNGVDGASAVQVLIDLKRHFAQPPYELVRMGCLGAEEKTVIPKLLLKETRGTTKNFSRIDLDDLSIVPLTKKEIHEALSNETMFYVDAEHTMRGLEK